MSRSEFPPDLKPKADEILKAYPEKQAALLPILHLFQDRDHHIAEGVPQAVAEYLGIPLMKVQEVLSFYTLFTKKPRGKHHFQICRTLTCSLLGGERQGECLGKRLGIKAGEVTGDGKFSYEMVECLGACEMAPMLCVDRQYIGPIDEKTFDKWLS